MSIIEGRYQASPTTVSDGKLKEILIDNAGRPQSVSYDRLTTTAARTTTGQLAAAATGRLLCGYSAVETGGAAAVLVIRHGTGVGDPALVYINLAANQSSTVAFPMGLDAASGIYFEKASGTATIVAHYKDAT